MGPAVLCALYALMSIVTFVVYAVDKRAAVRGAWRVRESTLHGLELGFGWPGALLAQQALRHKRRKTRFLLVTATMIALNVVVVGAAIWAVVGIGHGGLDPVSDPSAADAWRTLSQRNGS